MKPPMFTKTIRENDIVLGLFGPDEGGIQFMEADDTTYLNVGKPLNEKQLLNALSQAYELGYENGVSHSQEAVRRVLYERKGAHAPTPRIAETIDYRKSNAAGRP